ncbi:Neuroguidin [Entamoeba marina]
MEEIQRDHELIQQIKHISSVVQDLSKKISSLNEKLKANPLQTQNGISFFGCKVLYVIINISLTYDLALLFEYCVYLTYYCYIKSGGNSVSRHKAIERLLYLRILMERSKPIEKKLKYQIDKLLSTTEVDDTLTAKPDMDELVLDKNNTGVYKPPKIAGRALEATENEKSSKEISRQNVLQDVVDEEVDAPEEIAFGSKARLDDDELRKLGDIEDYEERMHVRVGRKNKKTKFVDDFAELEDFQKRMKGEVVDDHDMIDSDDMEMDDDEEIDSDDI